MRKIYQYIIFTALMLVSVLSMADVVADLTVGTVPVENRSQAALTKVAPQALQQVLVKMSGNPSITSNQIMQAAISQADQLVQTFSYSQQQIDAKPQLMVSIHFDESVLDKLLRQANQAVWRASRPTTLAWINLDDNTNNPNTILSSDEQVPAVSALRHDADSLGLPVLLPSMDLQDQSFINDDSNMPFDIKKLSAAAARYQVKSVLAGNIGSVVDGSWQGQWMFVLGGQPHQWNTVGTTPQVVIDQAMQDMDSIMSGQLAVRDNSKLQTRVAMQVSGVSTLDDYALVISDLKQLNVVARIAVAELDGATMKLGLNVVGGKQALLAALAHNTDLSNVSQPAVTTADSSDLYYQFQTNTNTNSGGNS
jgi:hypothetical protein